MVGLKVNHNAVTTLSRTESSRGRNSRDRSRSNPYTLQSFQLPTYRPQSWLGSISPPAHDKKPGATESANFPLDAWVVSQPFGISASGFRSWNSEINAEDSQPTSRPMSARFFFGSRGLWLPATVDQAWVTTLILSQHPIAPRPDRRSTEKPYPWLW